MPEPHLNSDTKDVVRLSTGLIATLSALVLGLLVASAQASYQDPRLLLVGATQRPAIAPFSPGAGLAATALCLSILPDHRAIE